MEKVGAYTDRATAAGEWQGGDVQSGLRATPMKADYFNMLQRELVGVVESAGLGLDVEDDGQLLAALKAMFTSHSWRDTTTDSLGVWALSVAPGEGRLALDNADPGLATSLAVGNVSADQLSYATTLGALRPGDSVTLRAGAFAVRLRIIGEPVEAAGGYRSIPVSYVSGSRILPAEGQQLSVAFWLSNAADMLNTARINVPSAANINLTTAAPASRNISITGATTITGFTVAAGQVFFVRFAASLTLTNSASLVTQTGANITTQTGDTCILRSLGQNVVEVLCYAQAARQDLGWGQTWQDVTASRAPNTTYTNTTGRPIVVSVSLYTPDSVIATLVVNGVVVARRSASIINYTDLTVQLTAIVPPGATYSVTTTNSATFRIFTELK